MKIRTWQIESLIVAVVLYLVWFFTGHTATDLLAANAVLFTFKHAQVADRMVEQQAIMVSPDVHCHQKANVYYLVKEVLWVGFFLSAHSWAALVGCGVFLFYPLWRKLWRKWHPLRQSQPPKIRGCD